MVIPDDVCNKVEQLAGLIKMQQTMPPIDPREYGRLEADVEALKAQVAAIDSKVDQLVKLASEGKGGIRALWFAGSVVAGVLGWVGADKVLK